MKGRCQPRRIEPDATAAVVGQSNGAIAARNPAKCARRPRSVLRPLELLERLAVLVPRPRINLSTPGEGKVGSLSKE